MPPLLRTPPSPPGVPAPLGPGRRRGNPPGPLAGLRRRRHGRGPRRKPAAAGAGGGPGGRPWRPAAGLPKLYLSGYIVTPELARQLAEPLDGPSLQQVAAAARRHGLAIACP
ncbi:MAG: hypothetical protein ACKO6F_06565, partial [Cyanobium sp.]